MIRHLAESNTHHNIIHSNFKLFRQAYMHTLIYDIVLQFVDMQLYITGIRQPSRSIQLTVIINQLNTGHRKLCSRLCRCNHLCRLHSTSAQEYDCLLLSMAEAQTLAVDY